MKPVSLGGHVSKAHPGMQSNYTHKMEVYKARTEHRKNLTIAKDWFRNTTGLKPEDYRVIVTGIKKIFMSGKEPNSNEIRLKLRR